MCQRELQDQELRTAADVKGKCPRAFHVTCAKNDEQVVYRLYEVAETVAGEDGEEPIQQIVLNTEILCPNHNPVSPFCPVIKDGADKQDVKEAKKAKAANELKAKVLAILPGQTVKVKSGSGMFEVKMVRVIENEQKAEVEHQNGQIGLIKWSEIDFRPAAAHKPLENEYGESQRLERGAPAD